MVLESECEDEGAIATEESYGGREASGKPSFGGSDSFVAIIFELSLSDASFSLTIFDSLVIFIVPPHPLWSYDDHDQQNLLDDT